MLLAHGGPPRHLLDGGLVDVELAGEDLDVVSVPGWQPAGLRRARKAAGMTQADLAGHLEVPRELIGRWETSGAPRAERVAQLARVLGVELSALLDLDNPFTERRLQAGLSQQHLAELAGVPRSTVQALEAGTAPPTSPAARAVETALASVGTKTAGSRPAAARAAGDAGRLVTAEPARRRPKAHRPTSPAAAAARWRPGALRQARKVAGLSQAELAAAVGVTREAVGRWEAGTAPRLERIRQVAAALGVDDVADLVERPEEEWSTLTALRIHAGLSQRQLAERTGLPRSSIQAVERGAFQPSEAMVAAYADACQVSLATVQGIIAKKA